MVTKAKRTTKKRTAKKRTVKRKKASPRRKPRTIAARKASALAAAVQDILGAKPEHVTVKLKKLGPGGTRAFPGDGDWSGNIYKYRY